ncbi:LysE family translocator [Flexivirga sp. ID2601S]|uniref:LysE family translocator n=1 Tax=Flexivirga aerilata TaxID=1656889 RepID=A0A849ALV2_9MICO|nr:LysE family translocator [Flexivirga aerilata]NNG39350.1 LysE family translocator [Flexivirga aerilata]
MLTSIDWTAFLPAAVLVSLVPGANQLLSLQHGARLGVCPALCGLAGRFAAFGIQVGLVAAGLAAIMLQSAAAFEMLRWLGVGYLVWLGFKAFRDAGTSPQPHEAVSAGNVALHTPVRREFLTAMSNPKAYLLFAAFVPQFITGPRDWVSLCVVGVAYIGVEAITAVGYVLLGNSVRGRLNDARRRRQVDRATGVGYLGIAGWLALKRRP